ncbi:uroporphyrinogen-III C-methyltransferase, partial [Kaarinaea lacus]
ANGLFKVQRTDQPIAPLLPPEEKHYLVNNLGLKIELARMALMKNDTELFRQNLSDIEKWTKTYFDVEDSSVDQLLSTLQSLKQVDLDPPLPDISASLRELRGWIELQQLKVSERTVDERKIHIATQLSPKQAKAVLQ